MEGYLVRINSRPLETKEQKEIPDRVLFFSDTAAKAYKDKLLASPIRFTNRQVSVFRVNLQILEEIQ